MPAAERLTISRGEWVAQATHMWTGSGWTRLVPGPVRAVPSALAPPSIYVLTQLLDAPRVS